MERISQLGLILNWKSLLIVLLAMLSTFTSLKAGIAADFPLTMISTAIVFPIVFSMSYCQK